MRVKDLLDVIDPRIRIELYVDDGLDESVESFGCIPIKYTQYFIYSMTPDFNMNGDAELILEIKSC